MSGVNPLLPAGPDIAFMIVGAIMIVGIVAIVVTLVVLLARKARSGGHLNSPHTRVGPIDGA